MEEGARMDLYRTMLVPVFAESCLLKIPDLQRILF